jgi:hypothetical protein
MSHEPGEVWLLPPAAEEGGDPKVRRHVLLTSRADSGGVGTLAYASTSVTEARFGAAHLFVDPAVSRSPRLGFARPSYVYPSRLSLAYTADLLRITGRITDEMPLLWMALRQALGMAGAGTRAPLAAPNWRGRVIRLTSGVSASIGCEHGIVVTEPAYSSRERYQIIVPVVDSGEFEPEPGDVEITEGDWLRAVAPSARGLVAAVPDAQSVFHPLEIDGWTGATGDDGTMRRIDEALVRLFGL